MDSATLQRVESSLTSLVWGVDGLVFGFEITNANKMHLLLWQAISCSRG